MAWYSGDGSSDDGSWASAEGGNGEASASGGKRSYSEVAASALTKSLFQDISQAEWDRILEEDLERQHDALVDDLAGNLNSETLSLVGGVEAVRNELEAADWDEAAAFNRLVLLISGGDDDDDDGEAAAGPSSDTPVDGPVPDGVGDGSAAAAAASPGNVELGVQVEWVEQGAAVTVAWACDDAYVAANTGTIGNDWIAFMPAGTEFSRLRDYSSWNWVTDGASTGTMTFTAPKAVGSYTFTYFRNKTYEVMATSPEVTVGPHYAVTAHQVVGGGTRIRVVVDQVFGADHPYAWVGLFADADASTALAMERLSNADADGAVFVNAPTAGEYEVRCFPYQYVAVSKANVTVVGDDAVELTHVIRGDGTNASDHRAVAKITMLSHNPATDRVWVGLYRVGEENNRKTHGGFTMRRYAYVTETVFEIDWKLPIHEGEYEARVFRNSSYDDADLLLRSAPIAGAALATIPAPTEEEGETTGGAVADALVGADE